MATQANNKTSVITVVGAGVMGTALAVHLSKRTTRKNVVRLCGTEWDDPVIDTLREKRRCPRLEVDIPTELELFYHSGRTDAVRGAEIIVIAVISKGLRQTVSELADYAGKGTVMVSITKGIDGDSLQTMAEMMERTLREKGRDDICVVKLGGPLRANEFAQGYPGEGVFAGRSEEATARVRECFLSTHFRSECSADVLGVDLCASLKNAYAIAFGMADGLYNEVDNPKAALFGRVAHEMSVFVAGYGGDPETVSHIAGAGDLFVTVQGGRNRTLGKYLGQGNDLTGALDIMNGQTVEGLDAVTEGWKIACHLESEGKVVIQRDLPLFYQLYQVIDGKKTAVHALNDYWAMTDCAD